MEKNKDRVIQQETMPQETQTDSGVSRRSFIRTSGVAAMAAAVGSQIPFGDLLPEGMQLVGMAHAQETDQEALDELGAAWRDNKLHLPLLSTLNGEPFGKPEAGVDMTFDFGQLIAHAARTRPLAAGTIVG